MRVNSVQQEKGEISLSSRDQDARIIKSVAIAVITSGRIGICVDWRCIPIAIVRLIVVMTIRVDGRMIGIISRLVVSGVIIIIVCGIC